MSHSLQVFCKGFAWFWLACAITTFLALPLGTVQAMFPNLGPRFMNYFGFLIFLFGLTSAVFYLLSRLPILSNTSQSSHISSDRKVYPRWLLAIQMLLSIVILWQCGSQIESPINFNESRHAISLLKGNYASEFTLRSHENHLLPQLLSLASLKAFGVSATTLRLPSLLFTLFFLIALNLFLRRHASPFSTLLMLLALATNQFFIWYGFSSRGYIGLTLFFFLAYWIAKEVTQKAIPSQKLSLYFGGTLLGAYSCHLFGALYGGLLFLTLLVWANCRSVTQNSSKIGGLIWIALSVLIIISLGVAWQGASLAGKGDFHSGSAPTASIFRLLDVFSLGRQWIEKLAIVFVCGVFYLRLSQKDRGSAQFTGLFLLITVAFLSIVVTLLEVRHLLPRFFLPLLVPFFYWLGEAVEQIKSNRFRYTLRIGALTLFALTPALFRTEVLQTEYRGQWEMDQFLKKVKLTTHPISKNCYDFLAHEQVLVDLAKDFYFHASHKGSDCQRRFVVHLSKQATNSMIATHTLISHPSGFRLIELPLS